jgi:hypothetical protein
MHLLRLSALGFQKAFTLCDEIFSTFSFNVLGSFLPPGRNSKVDHFQLEKPRLKTSERCPNNPM